MELADIRAEIDRLDDELVALLCRRMDCSLQVAAYKAAHHLPVLNEEREKQVLDGVRRAAARYDERGAGFPGAAAVVFSTMMDTSRALQHRKLSAGKALRAAIGQAPRRPVTNAPARVACAGCAGAYADEAAGILFPFTRDADSRPLFVPSFADVVEAVREGRADYGILPVENSSTGSVHENYDLLMQHRLSIVGAAELPVHHCLLTLSGADPRRLKAVYSHHQGLSQCADFIAAGAWSPGSTATPLPLPVWWPKAAIPPPALSPPGRRQRFTNWKLLQRIYNLYPTISPASLPCPLSFCCRPRRIKSA